VTIGTSKAIKIWAQREGSFLLSGDKGRRVNSSVLESLVATPRLENLANLGYIET
jgi:hypothetical protein